MHSSDNLACFLSWSLFGKRREAEVTGFDSSLSSRRDVEVASTSRDGSGNERDTVHRGFMQGSSRYDASNPHISGGFDVKVHPPHAERHGLFSTAFAPSRKSRCPEAAATRGRGCHEPKTVSYGFLSTPNHTRQPRVGVGGEKAPNNLILPASPLRTASRTAPEGQNRSCRFVCPPFYPLPLLLLNHIRNEPCSSPARPPPRSAPSPVPLRRPSRDGRSISATLRTRSGTYVFPLSQKPPSTLN